VGFGVWLAAWVIVTTAANLFDRMKRPETGASLGARIRSAPRSYYGMLLAHVGVAVLVLGVTLVKGYETEKDVRMASGDTVEVGGHVFRFMSVDGVEGPNYIAARATIAVEKHGRTLATLFPERRLYTVQNMRMSEAAIDTGIFRHLYVALSDRVDTGSWIVRVHHKPFVSWIWGGCLMMALGGILAASDRRYRLAARRAQSAPSSALPRARRGQRGDAVT
jgi:cytochrome c-type biogenesis protein CcmF